LLSIDGRRARQICRIIASIVAPYTVKVLPVWKQRGNFYFRPLKKFSYFLSIARKQAILKVDELAGS